MFNLEMLPQDFETLYSQYLVFVAENKELQEFLRKNSLWKSLYVIILISDDFEL